MGNRRHRSGEDRTHRTASGNHSRHHVATGTLLAALVALPALIARPWADERFYLYWPEQIAGRNPLRLIPRVIDEIPGYVEAGVFRPLSRLLVYLDHWIELRTAISLGIPPSVVRAVPKLLMIAVLYGVVLATIHQYRKAAGIPRESPTVSLLVSVTAVTFAASLVLLNAASHPLTLFPVLYLGTTAFALLTPLLLGRVWLAEREERPIRRRYWPVLSWAVLGAAIASMIELAYLAIPLAAIHLALIPRGVRPTRIIWRSPTLLRWLAMTLGFIAVFLPTRLAITAACARKLCYVGAEPSFTAEFFQTWPLRIASGFFPALHVAEGSQVIGSLRVHREFWVLALLAAAIAVWLVWRHARERDDAPSSRRWWVRLAAYYLAVVSGGAALAALSTAVQDRGPSLNPWRDTGFVWVGWTVVLAVAFTLIIEVSDRRRRPALFVVALVLGASVFLTSTSNQLEMFKVRAQPESRLHNQLAVLVVEFDRSPEGEHQRCVVIGELIDRAPNESEDRKMQFLSDLLDVSTRNHYGVPFCPQR